MAVYQDLADDELVSLLRLDDQAAFTEIYKRYWERLFVVANNRLREASEAEEVVQDVFFSIWRRRGSLELQYSLHTYLSVAVKYQVINRQASLYKQAIHLEINEESEKIADNTHLWFAENELREQLRLYVDRLPEKCRIVFIKSREDGRSNREIAEELNISQKTVEAHITRALSLLKGSLQVSVPLFMYLLKK